MIISDLTVTFQFNKIFSSKAIIFVMEKNSEPLVEHVKVAVSDYLLKCSDQQDADLYSIVMGQVEKTLISVVLEAFDYNQSRVARILGLSRSTLSKKIMVYAIVENAEKQELTDLSGEEKLEELAVKLGVFQEKNPHLDLNCLMTTYLQCLASENTHVDSKSNSQEDTICNRILGTSK